MAVDAFTNPRVGLLAYAVPPSEFSFATGFNDPITLEELTAKGRVPDFTALAIPSFFILIGIELIVGLITSKKLYRVNDAIGSIFLGSVMLLVNPLFKFIQIFVYVYIWNNHRIVDLPVDGWTMWIICLMGCDLGYYWMHRTAHTYHLLWTSHSVHHSGEDYNFATALRQGAFQASYSWVFQAPIALCCHPAVFLAHNALNTIGQFWIHTKIIGDLGPLEYVLNTPSHHRSHHRVPGNCNYAGVLIIWDRIFGTFVAEKEQIEAYGLAVQYDTFDPIPANIIHAVRQVSKGGFSHLFRRRAHHKMTCDLLAPFRPLPKGTAFARWNITDNVKDAKRIKTDFPQHISMTLYCMVQFLLLIGTSLLFLEYSHDFNISSKIILSILLLWCYSCVGRLFDAPSFYYYCSETLRLLVIITLVLSPATVNIIMAYLEIGDSSSSIDSGIVSKFDTYTLQCSCIGAFLYWILAMAFNIREFGNPTYVSYKELRDVANKEEESHAVVETENSEQDTAPAPSKRSRSKSASQKQTRSRSKAR
jgi:sterol desaturase/sphingolipid hydroxylase (fatty acid hydroxylase superfamily)